jgi:hypothetical protein
MENFPNNDDGRVLQELTRYGVKIGDPINLEFYCYADSVNTAQEICRLENIQDQYETDIFEDEEAKTSSNRFSVYFKKNIVLTYENVVNEQESLNKILQSIHIKCDGWGALIDNNVVL